MPIVTPTSGGAVPNVSTIASVNTFADVRLLGAGVFPVIEVLGGTTVGDGQDGVFYWKSTSVAADDGFAVLAPSAGGTGRWIRIYGAVVQSGTGAIAEDTQSVIRRLGFVSLTNFCSDAKRATILAGTQTDVTAELILAAATGKPIWAPYGIYEITAPVTISADLRFSSRHSTRAKIVLTGTGQLITGDAAITWEGFYITSAVNALTMMQVAAGCHYFTARDFQIVGTGTTQVGIEFAAGASGLGHCRLTNFLIQCATPIKTTGSSYVNSNHFGSLGDSFQSFTQCFDIQNTGGTQVNHFGGYCEGTGNDIFKIAASVTFQENTINLWSDKTAGTFNALNNAGTVGRNTWIALPPTLYTTTGAGSFVAQEFTEKVRAAVHLASDQTGVADATFTKIAFDTETYDAYGVMVSGTFTAPRAAKVHITAQHQMTTNIADQDSIFISIYKNSVEHTRNQVITSSANGAYAQIARTLDLVKGDQIEIYARADQAAANNNHIITGSALVTYFCVEEV